MLEATLRRPLEANEPFDEVWRRQRLRTACLRNDGSLLDLLAPDVKIFAQKFASEQKARKDAVNTFLATQYKGKSAYEITQAWWKDSASHIENWVTDYIQLSEDFLRLPDDPAEWPTPKQLPTAYAMHSYHMARIVMNVGIGAAIGDGDAHDAHHYAEASHGDVLVTHDKGMRATIKLIPSGLKVMDLEEFAPTIGVKQS